MKYTAKSHITIDKKDIDELTNLILENRRMEEMLTSFQTWFPINPYYIKIISSGIINSEEDSILILMDDPSNIRNNKSAINLENFLDEL